MTKFQRRLEMAIMMSGLTAREIAKKAELTEQNISQYRSGYSKPRNTERVYRLASALNVSPGWLMGYDGTMQPTDSDAIVTELKCHQAYEKALGRHLPRTRGKR